MAALTCCGDLHVYLIAGQSNAVGAAGNPVDTTTPNNFLENEYERYKLEHHAVCYAEQQWNRTNGVPAKETQGDFIPLQPFPDLPGAFQGRFGVELSLGRCLAFNRPSSWGPNDEVVMLKWGSGGTGIDKFLASNTDTDNVRDAMFSWVQSKLDVLQGICPDSNVIVEDMFWIQGEANATNGSSTYVPRFQELMTDINANLGPFRPIFSPLKRQEIPGSAAYDAGVDALNANMIAAGYIVSPDNNDIDFLAGQIHYDAPGYIELGNRLCYASRSN